MRKTQITVVFLAMLFVGLLAFVVRPAHVEASKFSEIYNSTPHVSVAAYNKLTWDEKKDFWLWRIPQTVPKKYECGAG